MGWSNTYRERRIGESTATIAKLAWVVGCSEGAVAHGGGGAARAPSDLPRVLLAVHADLDQARAVHFESLVSVPVPEVYVHHSDVRVVVPEETVGVRVVLKAAAQRDVHAARVTVAR